MQVYQHCYPVEVHIRNPRPVLPKQMKPTSTNISVAYLARVETNSMLNGSLIELIVVNNGRILISVLKHSVCIYFNVSGAEKTNNESSLLLPLPLPLPRGVSFVAVGGMYVRWRHC